MRAFLFVEGILFGAIGIGYIFKVGQKNTEKDYFGYAMIVANSIVGAGLLLDAPILKSPLYLPALSVQTLLGLLFLGTAVMRGFSFLQSERENYHKFSKVMVLPWMGFRIR